jgi:hypothetical protein
MFVNRANEKQNFSGGARQSVAMQFFWKKKYFFYKVNYFSCSAFKPWASSLDDAPVHKEQ